jgi:hypothetical protein
MKPDAIERLLLLERSGELAPRQRAALARAEAAGPGAVRAARSRLDALDALFARAPAVPLPPPDVLAGAIRRRLDAPPSRHVFPWKPLLAVAAAFAIALGLLLFHGGTASLPAPSVPAFAEAGGGADDAAFPALDEDPYAAEFSELETLIAAIEPPGEEWLYTGIYE